MAPKKSQLKTLKKGVNAKKAAGVKGGTLRKPLEGISTRNHNMVLRTS